MTGQVNRLLRKFMKRRAPCCSNYAKSNGMVYHQLVSMHDNERTIANANGNFGRFSMINLGATG